MGSYAQNKSQMPLLRLMNYSGTIGFQSEFFNKSWLTQEQTINQKGYQFSGDIGIYTKSYIYHPNFVILDVGGAYSPGKNSYDLEALNYSSRSSNQNLTLKASFFPQKDINFATHYTRNKSYISRENLSDIQTSNISKGAEFNFINKVLPIQTYFNNVKLKEEDNFTKRTWNRSENNFSANTERSFFSSDIHRLDYFYKDFIQENKLDSTSELFVRPSTINKLLMSNSFDLKNFKTSPRFNSRLDYTNRTGWINEERFTANEDLRLQLSEKLINQNRYSFYQNNLQNNKSQRHNFNTALQHQLFLSLKSNVFFNYAHVKRNSFLEKNYTGGLSLNYLKKIPTTGYLSFNYSFTRRINNNYGDDKKLTILNEELTLTDGQLAFLERPNVIISSVVVSNLAGTIFYQPNFDYILIPFGNNMEIRRVPGGLIANGETVNINYQVTQNNNYNVQSNIHIFGSSISFFKDLIKFSYTRSQTAIESNTTQDLSFNEYKANELQARIRYRFATAGIKYHRRIGNIFSSEGLTYFANLNYSFNSKLALSLSANKSSYVYGELNQLDYKNNASAISAQIAYNINYKNKINSSISYQDQEGDRIKLKLLRLRIEYTATLSKLYATLGVDAYNRDYQRSQTELTRVFIRITRNF